MLSFSRGLTSREISTPRDLYLYLRKIWAESVSNDETFSKDLLLHPFVKMFEPSKVVSRFLGGAKTFDLTENGSLPSMTEEQKALSLSELCQLALLKVIGERQNEADELIQKLLTLLPFSALWVSEELYDPIEFYFSAYIIYSYTGFTKEAALCKMAILGAKNPFFTRLEEALSLCIPSKTFSLNPFFMDKPTGTWVSDRFAITLSGYGTSLGAFREEEVEIRAFGPQFYPLTNSKQFGIRAIHAAQTIDEKHISGWTCCFSEPDVWLHVEALLGGGLHVRWVGLTTEKKGAFVFYVKAKTALVENHLFVPRSLQRYRGIAKEIHFNEGSFSIYLREPRQMELIPLAGEGCFWNSDFLIAFEMSPFDSEECFSFRK